jgi:hypothetical protein
MIEQAKTMAKFLKVLGPWICHSKPSATPEHKVNGRFLHRLFGPQIGNRECKHGPVARGVRLHKVMPRAEATVQHLPTAAFWCHAFMLDVLRDHRCDCVKITCAKKHSAVF